MILSSKSDPSFSYLVFKTKFVVSILSNFPTNLSYSVSLTTSFFTALLNLANSLETGSNLSMSNQYVLYFLDQFLLHNY